MQLRHLVLAHGSVDGGGVEAVGVARPAHWFVECQSAAPFPLPRLPQPALNSSHKRGGAPALDPRRFKRARCSDQGAGFVFCFGVDGPQAARAARALRGAGLGDPAVDELCLVDAAVVTHLREQSSPHGRSWVRRAGFEARRYVLGPSLSREGGSMPPFLRVS